MKLKYSFSYFFKLQATHNFVFNQLHRLFSKCDKSVVVKPKTCTVFPLISMALIRGANKHRTIDTSNKRLPLISATPENATLIINLTLI